jgi:hypothetical protein
LQVGDGKTVKFAKEWEWEKGSLGSGKGKARVLEGISRTAMEGDFTFGGGLEDNQEKARERGSGSDGSTEDILCST